MTNREDAGKLRHHSEMGGYHPKENPSNGNLRWRSIVTKDTNDPKGWPHPEGRQKRRNTVEGSPHNQAREEEPTQAEAHSVSPRQWNRTKTKSKPNQSRESNVTIVDWGRTQTVPETGDRTCRLGTPQNPGGQRHSSSTMASQQVPDKEPG